MKKLKEIRFFVTNAIYNFFQEVHKNKLTKSLLVASVVLGAVITIGKFSYDSWSYYYENLAVTKNISDKIEELSAGQSVNYFKQILGNEVTTKNISSDYKELIFKYKTSYLQTVVNDADTVIFFSVTDCRNPVQVSRPSFMSAYSGDEKIFPDSVILNRTTFKDFLSQDRSNIQYFLSGATSNSYYYETVYGGNPGNYQTLFVGINDICGRFYEECMLHGSSKCSEEDLQNFRKSAKVNTFGESAPGMGGYIEDMLQATTSDFYLGPDRIELRVFNSSY